MNKLTFRHKFEIQWEDLRYILKQIYEVGTAQYFTYTTFLFFKKKVEEHWVIRNVKYIYANNEEEAKEKYKQWFFREYKGIIQGWGDWYLTSNGVDLYTMSDKNISITKTKIIAIDNKYLNVKYEALKENMQAEDFKEWWFDNGRYNRIPE